MKTWGTRTDFPILQRRHHTGKRLVYLDSAATSQKPRQVIESIGRFYEESNANPNRGVYELSQKADHAYESAREKVAKFIGAKSAREIVFVRNTTEAINLVRFAWANRNVKRGERIVSTTMEHHSNLVPWPIVRAEVGAEMAWVDFDSEGQLVKGELEEKIDRKTKFVAVTQASNVLGTINPIEKITRLAHDVGARVLVDGAQAVPHDRVDVKRLGCDFYAFSVHKMLGPMGTGVLWAKEEVLEEMEPFLVGGGMISRVGLSGALWKEIPHRFEAGTPNVEGAVGLASAIDYLQKIGMANVRRHEVGLTGYALKRLAEMDGLTVYGPGKAEQRAGLVSFNLEGIHPHDLAQILDDKQAVAIRSGHHCAQPLHERIGVPATARASFYVYNTKEDIDRLCLGLQAAREIFQLK